MASLCTFIMGMNFRTTLPSKITQLISYRRDDAREGSG